MVLDHWRMFADEADFDGSKEYLVFSAVFIPTNATLQISRQIEAIRLEAGFRAGDDFKFSSTTRPRSVDQKAHKEAKNSVIELAKANGCRICLYLAPVTVARKQTKETQLKYGTNTLLSQYNRFLEEHKAGGIAFFDRLTEFSQFDYFKEVFQQALEFQHGRRRLSNVLVAAPTTNNASHLSSLADIVAGAFRWVVNEPEKDRVGKALMKSLAPLMWGKSDENGNLDVRERGLCIRPKQWKVTDFEADSFALLERIASYADN